MRHRKVPRRKHGRRRQWRDRGWHYVLLLVLMTALAGAFREFRVDLAGAAEPSLTVQAGADGSITVSGTSQSLVGVVERVCAAAEVDLHWYRPKDQVFRGTISGVSPRRAVERLLGSRSYLLGLRRDPGTGQDSLAWVRIFDSGDGELEHLAHSDGVLPATEFLLADSMLERAFVTEDGTPADATALAEVSQTILSSPEALARFLASDTSLMARTLLKYPSALATLANARLSGRVDPRISAKIEAIIDKLTELESSPRAADTQRPELEP